MIVDLFFAILRLYAFGNRRIQNLRNILGFKFDNLICM